MPDEAPQQPSPPERLLWTIALVFAGWSALHLGIIAALASRVVPGGAWTFLAIFGLLLAAIARILHGFRPGVYPGKWQRILVARPFWYAQVALLVLSPTGALAWLAGLPFGRGLAWAQAALGWGLIVLAALFVAGYVGSRSLVVRRLEFRFPDLPAAFDGLTLAQVSDLHVGPHTPQGFLRRVVRAVEDAKPDLIAYTGDQVDDYEEDVARFGAVFGPVRAPLGAYAIAGNHDVYAGWPAVRDGMRAVGMHVLVNEAMPLRREGGEIWIAGTGDPAGLRSFDGAPVPDVAPDVAKTLAGIPPGAFTLALAHNPALWPALAKRGVHLTLSGHTHHGQLSIPLLGWSLASPFLEHAMGTHRDGERALYINPGTNYWGLPLRLGAWPEVTIVTLRRSPAEADAPRTL